jgi:hypothetical protein
MDSWSRKYFFDLNDFQHDVNDAWFARMLKLLKPAGVLVVPTLRKAFNSRGEEADMPGEAEDPPNRA